MENPSNTRLLHNRCVCLYAGPSAHGKHSNHCKTLMPYLVLSKAACTRIYAQNLCKGWSTLDSKAMPLAVSEWASPKKTCTVSSHILPPKHKQTPPAVYETLAPQKTRLKEIAMA